MLKIMTLEEAIDTYCDDLDSFIQECAWTHEWSSDKALDLLSIWSRKDGYVLADLDHYDELLHNVYESTEKGLS